MIEHINGYFGIHGEGFSCLLRVNEYGLLELLHYGEPVETGDGDAFLLYGGPGWGGSVVLDDAAPASCPDAMPLCWSGAGRGDYRESPLELGGRSTDFRYAGYEITEGGVAMSGGLPQAKGAEQTLCISLKQPGLELKLYFSVFGGVLSRRAVLTNVGDAPATLTKFMSSLMDLHGQYEMTSFNGGWIAEMRKCVNPVGESRVVNESVTGFSSNRHNPGFMLSESYAETFGGANGELFLESVRYLCGSAPLDIPARSIGAETLTLTAAQGMAMGALITVVLPLSFVIAGTVVVIRRRRRA